MLLFDEKTLNITCSHGGYTQGGLPIQDTYVQLSRDLRGILYEPVQHVEKSRIAVAILHSDSDYSIRPIGGELAKRGYITLCGQVSAPTGPLDRKLQDLCCVIRFLRSLDGVEKVVLMGHSGGATLMSSYQAVAENGAQVFQGEEKVYRCTLQEPLPPADGLMLLDANWGNAAMTLFSIDPAVVEEGNGIKLDPELDCFRPENGYDPAGSHYTQAFIDRFYAAQRERNERLIRLAMERLHAIEHGKGYYADDEPFVITGGAWGAPCNKLFPLDTSLLAHTKGAYPLLRQDGITAPQVIQSVRAPFGWSSSTGSLRAGGVVTTVRAFLNDRAIMTKEGYGIREDGVYGVDWNSSFGSVPGNVQHVSIPLLCMGMTGGYEYLAAEEIFGHAASQDRTIGFVEGASHLFSVDPSTEQYAGQYGDTQKLLYDYVDEWMAARFL